MGNKNHLTDCVIQVALGRELRERLDEAARHVAKPRSAVVRAALVSHLDICNPHPRDINSGEQATETVPVWLCQAGTRFVLVPAPTSNAAKLIAADRLQTKHRITVRKANQATVDAFREGLRRLPKSRAS